MPPRGSRTRARGRARGAAAGRAQENPQQDPMEHVLDPILNQLTDMPVPSSIIPLPSENANTTPKIENSPKKAEPSQGTAIKPAAAKFKPRMVKRVEKPQAEAESNNNQPDPTGTQGRGRGRGRGGAERGGRGRAEIVMTASGAFAMGPAEASARSRIQGPTRSGMRKIDNSVMPTIDKSRTTTNGSNTPYENGILELYSDADEEGSDDQGQDEGGRTRIADINDITLENEMAPSSLPWDPKRIADREKLIQERNEKILKLSKLKIKQEEENQQSIDQKDSKPILLGNSNSSSSKTLSIIGLTSREATIATVTEHSSNDSQLNGVEKSEDQHNAQLQKSEIELKQEQLDELTNVGQQFLPEQTRSTKTSMPGPEGLPASNGTNGLETGGSSSLYVFQFPRTFPKFQDPTKPWTTKNEREANNQQSAAPRRIIKKKKKPGLDDWLGWGKGGRRTDRMGVPSNDDDAPLNDDASNVQGQIGELVIRRSGRVQMIIANVVYDVLPGSQPSFHQEIAVIDPKPESNLRAMFVLGSTRDKFIVAPDISSLLQREQQQKPSNLPKP